MLLDGVDVILDWNKSHDVVIIGKMVEDGVPVQSASRVSVNNNVTGSDGLHTPLSAVLRGSEYCCICGTSLYF